MRILLTGGTGFIGGNLVDRLAGEGHQCILLVRRDPAEYEPKAGIHYVPYESISSVRKVDAVVNLAGEWVVGRWTPEKKSRILASRIATTSQLIDWMQGLKVRPGVLLSASAVGIYGHRPGEILTERSPLDPEQRFRYKVCRRWEDQALRADSLGVRTVLLRIGNVLDTGGGFLGIMLPWLRWLPVWMRLCPTVITPWIALEDALRMVEFALEDDRIAGPLNVVGPQPASLGKLVEELGRSVRRPVVGRVPDWAVRAALGEFSSSFCDSQDVRPTVALAGGFAFRHPDLREFLRKSLGRQS